MQNPTRIEEYLAKATGGSYDEPLPDPVTRIELYLAKIAGEDVTLPERPITHIEQYLAKIAGEDVELPDYPKTRIEMLLANAAGEDVDEVDPITRIEGFIAELQSAGTLMTYTGNLPTTITALAKAIHSLTQYGLCTQASTPDPSAPVDIKCNNGALKMVDDELPIGYKRVLGFTCNNNAMWEITGFNLKGCDTVRIAFSATAACNVFGCYQGTDAIDNYDLYVSTTSGSKYFRYGNGTYLSYWSADDLGQRFDVTYTPNGSTGMPQDSTWSPATFTAANDLLIGSTTTTGTSSKLKGNLYGNFIVDGRLKLIPCERVSDNVLGYYDTYSETFYEPYTGFDGAVSLGYDGSHYSLATFGTPEVLSLAPIGSATQDGTPSPTNPVPIVGTKMGNTELFAINTNADTYDPSTQTITRRIGVKVLNGTEEWGRSQGIFYLAGVTPAPTENYDHTCLCTHFIGVNYADGTPASKSDKIYVGNSYFPDRMIVYPSLLNEAGTAVLSLDEWKAWLAEQNTNGTPVTVYYPLAEPTTEAYTGAPVGGTATVADLFAVGDYKDTQELIGGTVTHRVGVKVLDGTEDWRSSTTPSVYYVVINGMKYCNPVEKGYSSHFVGSNESNVNMPNGSCKNSYTSGGDGVISFKYTSASDITEWTAWLAEQYALGTPVIVIYPLAEEDTESVTPQHLHTNAGGNYVSATAEVSPISVEIVYTGEEVTEP